MGTVRVEIGVGHPHGRDLHPVSALVDTGAGYSMLPAALSGQLGLTPLERLRFKVADGRRVEYDVADARFSTFGRKRFCPVSFGPAGQFLVGAATLEIFNLVVDPTEGESQIGSHKGSEPVIHSPGDR